MFKKFLITTKRMLIGIGVLLGGIFIIGVLFVNLSPEFGGKATKKQKELYTKSQNYRDGKFSNLGNVRMSMDFGKIMRSLSGYFNPPPETAPSKDIAVSKID